MLKLIVYKTYNKCKKLALWVNKMIEINKAPTAILPSKGSKEHCHG